MAHAHLMHGLLLATLIVVAAVQHLSRIHQHVLLLVIVAGVARHPTVARACLVRVGMVQATPSRAARQTTGMILNVVHLVV